ncbi:Lytic transglycolase [uncultured archaeon]|nr:Lytic transglycolase [uncultured archaeon]
MKKTTAILTTILGVHLLTPVMQAPAAPKPMKPTAPRVVKAWQGMVSWYGKEWAGKKMANGHLYDPQALTAAHPVLSFGTWVRVTNLTSGRSEFAKITDRGPYVEGREMDVSERVAERIGIKEVGVAHVKIEIIRFADGSINYFMRSEQ